MNASINPGVERRVDAARAEALAPLGQAIESARGLPNRAYTTEAFLALERRQLFPRTWMFVAPASDVPEPGDIRPVVAAGLPLLLVRGATWARPRGLRRFAPPASGYAASGPP